MTKLPKQDSETVEYAAFSKEEWDSLDGLYSYHVDRWRRTLDYIRGDHWEILKEKSLDQIPDWRRFPVKNLTMGIFIDYVTQWLQSKVRYSAIPDSYDPGEVSQAALADHVLRYLWDIEEMDDKRIDLGAWLVATGNADTRTRWNANTGEMLPLAVPEIIEGQMTGKLIPIDPETMEPDPTMQEPIMVDAGEIDTEVISPQLVRWSVNKAHGAMVGRLLDYDEAIENYGEEIAKEMDFSVQESPISLDLLYVKSPNISPVDSHRSLVIEHYLPRSWRHPGGLWWTSANKKLLTLPSPLPSGKIPLVHWRWVPFPGHHNLGTSPLYDITYQNKVLDEVQARKQEWTGKIVPKIFFPTGSGVAPGDLNEEPGQELPVTPGPDARPYSMEMPQPPAIFDKMEMDANDGVMTIGGYKFTRPQSPAPGTSANTPRQPPRLMNQGEQVALAQINSAPSWKELGRVLLAFAASFYEDERVAGVIGPDRTYQWRSFKGADLSNLRARIRVEELPLHTWDKQSMKDSVIGVLNSPAAQVLFTDSSGQPDRERIEAAMEVVGLNISLPATDPDVLQARNENHIIRSWGPDRGQPPQAKPFENHQEHIAQHTRIMKTMEFQGWDQQKQQALMQHVSGHEQFLSKAEEQKKQGFLEQEKALRQIRAETETQGNIKTAIGEEMAGLMGRLFELMLEERNKEER